MILKNYSVVNRFTGVIENIIVWDGLEGWAPPEGYWSVEAADGVVIGGSYVDGKYVPPPIPEPPELTADEILAANTSMRDARLASASQAMTPLLLSLQLGDATPDETKSAKAWQAYVRSLKSLDMKAANPNWPKIPS